MAEGHDTVRAKVAECAVVVIIVAVQITMVDTRGNRPVGREGATVGGAAEVGRVEVVVSVVR